MPPRQHRLSLDEAANPEFFEIFHSHTSLMGELDSLNLRLHSLRPGIFSYFKCRESHSAIGGELKLFVSRYLEWKQRASNFLLKPHFVIESPEHELVFRHFLDSIRDCVWRLETAVTLLESNYNFSGNQLESLRNFTIAVSGWIATVVSLVLTVWALLQSPP